MFNFYVRFGIGTFYKVTEKIGLNHEFQYNKLSEQEIYSYNNLIKECSGFYTIEAGIMYTNF